MFERAGGSEVFSKGHLKTGFHQIGMKVNDVKNMVLNTHYRLLQYLTMHIIDCNTPTTPQALMNQVFYHGMGDFLMVYINDLLVLCMEKEIPY